MTIPTGPDAPSVADAQRIIASLVAERQSLRAAGATRERLEANRLALVYWQDRLSRALVAQNVQREAS